MPEFPPYSVRSVAELIPYIRNARTHSDAQVAMIAASIREFGFTNPVLIDGERGIIAGHGRILAARKLGMDAVPCIELSHLSDTQRRAYILADNQLALKAGWDAELLNIELAELRSEGFDLALAGFEDADLAKMLKGGTGEGLTDPDETPDPPPDPISRLGDVWLLGRHRIVCGDSTSADVVAKALNGVKPHLMVTDPPYGVEYDASWRVKSGLANKGAAVGKVLNDDRSDWRETWALFPGEVAYVWHGERQLVSMGDQLQASGCELRNLIVWAKGRFARGRGHYHSQHETCWYVVRKGGKGYWQGARDQATLWQIDHTKSETGHSTQKPVECMKRPIENNSSPGQAVYEPFSGSGTTIIAAEMTGRACHAIELNPAYVDVAVKRWQDFTGQQATLEATGQAFAEVGTGRPQSPGEAS